MAALSVEHLKVLSSPLLSMAALTVEHLKVMAALSVEPACASSDGGPYGRAPKGPYQSST